MIDHALRAAKLIFDQYKVASDIPLKIDYKIGMLLRNMLVFAIFRYFKPSEIKIEYLNLLKTQNSTAFLEVFVCPCGKTFYDYVTFRNLNKKIG